MKIFEIVDGEVNLSIGILLYYEKEGTCIIELQEYLDEWTAPLLLTAYVKKKIYTIPRDVSLMWVRERVIPSGRQNIDDILRNHGLKSYDEMKFLEISGGKCSQDSLYIRKVECLPQYVLDRMGRNIVECVAAENNTVLCFFEDDEVRKIDLAQLKQVECVDKVIGNVELFRSCKVGTGGYFITFNDSIDIPAGILHKSGKEIPLTLGDFKAFVKKNVVDTTESCDILMCSRQNIAYLIEKQQLAPVKSEVRGNLYLKGQVLRNKW